MRQRSCLIILILAVLPSARADEPAAVIPGESRSTATRLEEAGKRLAEKKTPEAITLLQNVIDAAGNDLVPLKGGRSLRARHLAHAALARLDAKGIAAYRARIDPQAKKWLEEAAASGQVNLLHRMVDEAFCSSHTPAALDQLGDRAFERGAFDQAEQYWQLLAPLEPTRLADSDPDTLFYPDPAEPLAIRTRAKQILARIFRGKPGWQSDLAAFRKRYPKASGALAGRTGLYADILQAVADARSRKPPPAHRDWPTFAGDASRNRVASVPPRFLERLSQLCRPGPTWRFDLERRDRQVRPFAGPQPAKVIEAARRLAFHPVVIGHHAVVADGRYITAYDLRTGRASTWYDPITAGVGGIGPILTLPTPVSDLRYTLTVSGDRLFARLGEQSIKNARFPPRRRGGPARRAEDNPESILVCIDAKPGKDGNRRRWMARAAEPGRHAFFEGAPVVADGRVYIAVTRFEGDRALTAIHCYPADAEDTAPLPLWRTEVCETRELLQAGAFGDTGVKVRNRHHLLTAAGSRVVYCSHSGAIVALDGRTGSRIWAVRYPHLDIREPEDDPGLRDLAPCLFADGLLYAAPSDSESLLCLDPATGATVWQRERLDVVHLLGVGQGKLIFTTWHNPQEGKLYTGGLRAVGALDGSDRTGWSLPDDGGGLAPFGRGLLVGDLVLWPTARKPFGVFAVRQSDGMQPDNPSLLHRVPSGNLVYANGCLLVTDQQTMYAFVPPQMLSGEEAKGLGKKTTDGPTDRLRLEAIVHSAETSRAAGNASKAQAAWQKVSADEELSKLSIEDENGLPQSAGTIAASRLSKRPSAREPRENVAVNHLPLLLAVSRLPLSPSCDLTLAPGERLLRHPPMTAAFAGRIWSNLDRTLLSHDRWTGEPKWKQTLPFIPEWLTGIGNLIVAGGREGVSARKVSDGQPIWTFLAPPLGRYPGTLGGELRVIRDTLPPEPLHHFHVTGDRLFVLQGERRLLALDAFTGRVIWQRWAPGATFLMPPPRGRFGAIVPIGDDNLLVQVSGRRWLLDAATGKVRHEAPTSLQRWPRNPIVLDANRVCTVNSNNIEVFDAASAKTMWTWPLPGKTTRSGEPPLVAAFARARAPAGDDLFVIVPENIGYRLHRLDSKTGKPRWSQALLIILESLEPDAWLAGPNAIYHADGGTLTARSRTDGSILWQRPLSAPGVWKLALAGDTLVLHPQRGPGLRFRFRWLAGSVQWHMGPLTGDAPPSVELVDAEKGTLLQRINLEDVSPRADTRLDFTRTSVWPSARFLQEPSSAAGVSVWWDDKGLLAGAGNRVKSLAAQSQPGK